eukprot:TRINITY_DN29368_c0_g1_i1.p1 TRINITY_DN29368_c0_g1~~TRINITY_DN29368_c0_g1_i1.p1  ORF type:complete len:922 (-),score=144.40 TRINITY_DN29368_c0_g1_i1:62-2827(-)
MPYQPGPAGGHRNVNRASLRENLPAGFAPRSSTGTDEEFAAIQVWQDTRRTSTSLGFAPTGPPNPTQDANKHQRSSIVFPPTGPPTQATQDPTRSHHQNGSQFVPSSPPNHAIQGGSFRHEPSFPMPPPELESVSRVVKELGCDIQRDCRSELRAATRRMQQDLQKELRNAVADIVKVRDPGCTESHELNAELSEGFMTTGQRKKAAATQALRLSAAVVNAEPLTRGQVGDLSLSGNASNRQTPWRKLRSSPRVPNDEDSDGDRIKMWQPQEPPPLLPVMAPPDPSELECFLPGICNINTDHRKNSKLACQKAVGFHGSGGPGRLANCQLAGTLQTPGKFPSAESQADEAAGGFPAKDSARPSERSCGKCPEAFSAPEFPGSNELDDHYLGVKVGEEPEDVMYKRGSVLQADGDGRPAHLTCLSISREMDKSKAKKESTKPLWRMSAKEMLHSQRFDNLVGSLILLNAITIGAQTDYNAVNMTDFVTKEYYIIDWIFCVAFTTELALRLMVYRCKFFSPYNQGCLWNYFDTFVVSAQLLEIFADFLASSTSVNTDQLKLLRVLRILRLVRILRVVRVLHLISELRTIVSSIIGSFRSLGWTVILLLLMIYIVAVYFTQAITDHLVERSLSQPTGLVMTEGEEKLHSMFGSMGRSILTLWQAMSGGIDWNDVAGPMLTEVTTLSAVMFAGYIAFALLALMNVVTGVFVQTALNSARLEEDAFMTSQIVSLFNMVGRDAGASITYEEVSQSLEDPATEKEWKSIGVNAGEARYLFRLLDVDGSGSVAFEEFLAGCLRLNGTAKAIDLLTVMQEARRVNDRTTSYQQSYESSTQTMTESLQELHEFLEDYSVKTMEKLTANAERVMEACDENTQLIRTVKRAQQGFQGEMVTIKARLASLQNLDALLAATEQPPMPEHEALSLV